MVVTQNPNIKKKKKRKEKRIYVNKIENKITFKIKTGYYLEFLMSETIKLFGSTITKITKDKIG